MGLRRLAASLAIPLALAAIIVMSPDRYSYAVCIRDALPYDAWTRYDLPYNGMVYICYLPPGVHTWLVNITQASMVRIYEIHAGAFIRCAVYSKTGVTQLCPIDVRVESLGGGVVRLVISSNKWLWVENFYAAETCIDC